MIEVLNTTYHDEKEAQVYPYKGRSFTSSEVMYKGERFFFWTSATKKGRLRLEASQVGGDKRVVLYSKDRGELIFSVADRFFNRNAVRKALV